MKTVKKKGLEIKLEEIPSHPTPRADLEQYSTPSVIAADILFTAFSKGDISGKHVLDLGCGTGIFALGAALLGASHVEGIDIDREAVDTAKDIMRDWSLSDVVDFKIMDVNDYGGTADTILMNPPFGSQKRSADIPFMKKAFEIATKIYSVHNCRAKEFIRELIMANGYNILEEKRYMFGVDNIFKFHKKKKKEFEVVMFVSSRDRTS